MDREQFDNLTRALVVPSSRRGFGGLLLALGIGTSLGFDPLRIAEAEARRKKRRRRKRKKNTKPKTTPCTPNCDGKFCGDDGCGGSCGQCAAPFECCIAVDGMCGHCVEGLICHEGRCCDPSCAGKECGVNDCGMSCGSCPIDEPICTSHGTCVPLPNFP